MPLKIGGTRRGGAAAVAAGLLALALAPSAQAAGPSNPTGCTPAPTLTQPFAAWGDNDFYTPVVNSGFEAGSRGWLLSDGASVVAGNEPWRIGGAGDAQALDLPSGETAVSAPMCIDATYADFRFFARKLDPGKGRLKVDVLYLDGKGDIKAGKTYTHTTTDASWQPTDTIDIDVFSGRTTDAAPVAFRFTADKSGSHFEIDDVYVDPMNRR